MVTGDTVKQASAVDFTALTIDVAPDLLAYFARRVVPGEDAADCVSETLLVLWRRRNDLPDDVSEARAWAFGIAHRVLLAHGRGRVRQTVLTERLRASLSIAVGDRQEGLRDSIREELARLGQKDREIVALVAWEGFSLVEVAQVLGISPEAARARYSRARGRLRKALE